MTVTLGDVNLSILKANLVHFPWPSRFTIATRKQVKYRRIHLADWQVEKNKEMEYWGTAWKAHPFKSYVENKRLSRLVNWLI